MYRFIKLWNLLELQQKKHASILFFFIFLGTIIEIIGIGLAVP